MYAIVEIAGQQFKVEHGRWIFVHRLPVEEKTKIVIDRVLLVDNNDSVQVGVPVVEGAKVAASVLSHLKGDKVIIFKKKRRKGYQKASGHRQYLTQLMIDEIYFGDVKVGEDGVQPILLSQLSLQEADLDEDEEVDDVEEDETDDNNNE